MPATLKSRPAPGSATARVWEIADELSRRDGGVPSGREVVNRYVAENGNEGTGFTQFSHWKRHYLAKARPAARSAGVADRLAIGADGLVAIPLRLLAALGLDEGGSVAAQVVDGELRLTPTAGWLHRARQLVSSLDRSEGSVADELIAERRAEAARE